MMRRRAATACSPLARVVLLLVALVLATTVHARRVFSRRTCISPRSFLVELRAGGSSESCSSDDEIDVGVGVKKSNAVGDPDGEGSSDDDQDDDDTSISEWDMHDDDVFPETTVLEQVQVQVEYVEDQEDDAEDKQQNQQKSGGVMRLGQRFTQRKHNRNSSNSIEQHLLAAWQPHIFLPPCSWDYLTEHARALDADSKSRLDRRTLYAGLLLEWTASPMIRFRKFLSPHVSQRLQAALSLASQPAWRKSFPRPNAIRLYENREGDVNGCTLAMQETIAMALAHSLNAGMIILDDAILSSIRQQLLANGYSEQDVKPAALLKSVLALARQGTLCTTKAVGSVSKCMRADLQAGLDDPFDDRAMASCEEMTNWEKEISSYATNIPREVPLVIFLRTEGSTSLLKSKSAVDVLLNECNSNEGRNFLVLGKGVDARTHSLPEEPQRQLAEQQGYTENSMGSASSFSQNLPSAAPWFGFTPHNQNASGQNDPEGSRRFNIFLARTVDPSGAPGIVGAVAPPEAGNLFPHMMAMQARVQLQQHDDSDSPAKASLEQWAQMLQQRMQTNGGTPLPPPQFFNASLTAKDGSENAPMPPPEVIQETIEQAMSELLDRLAQMNEDGSASSEMSPHLQKAFAQVLRNENLRRGIAENLARATPALSDPKCQGVLLSVFVPPPPQMNNKTSKNGNNNHQPMGNWFQKMLNSQEESDMKKEPTEANRRNAMEKRVRTLAAAAAVKAAEQAKGGDKADRNLAKLEVLCRPIVLESPADPVRAKSWESWIQRERGAVLFRQNRRVLNEQLEKHHLSLQEHTGTKGAGSALRQMLSVRLLEEQMADVIKCAIEIEAAKSQRQHESPEEMHENEKGLDVDITLSQLLLTDDGMVATEDVLDSKTSKKRRKQGSAPQFLHPSSLESALTTVCRISPSPAGGLSTANTSLTHRSKDEIAALAQDKHERALVSQVVSPQDIGVSYDMIGGLTEVKELLRQSITYPLKFPHLYSEGIAREAVKGVLLFGPPGTGKTMLAKAVATEGGANFLSVDASSVENKWLGESEKNAKAVFTLARRLAPCVVFIDEVDSLLSSREGTSDDSAHGTLTSVKTTMMSEWDGLNSGTNGAGEAGSERVVVIGSTNRPFDLDEAVLRRFPRRILVDLPDLTTRTEILEVTLAENRLDAAVNLTSIAERLEGYTGSDIKEVCREAVVQISHEQAKILDQGFANSKEDVTEGSLQRLRPVTSEDFEKALTKLKRSVSEKGRELARVWEWNDEYGEIKRETKNRLPHLANMYL